MLLQQWYEVLGFQWAGVAQVEDHNVGVDLAQASNANTSDGKRKDATQPTSKLQGTSAHSNVAMPGQSLWQGPRKHMPWQLCLKAVIKQGRGAHQVCADVDVGATGQSLRQQ